MSKKKGKTPKKPKKLKADWRKQYQRPQPAMQGIAQQSPQPQPNPLNPVAEIPPITEVPEIPPLPEMEMAEQPLSPQPSTNPQQEEGPEPSQELPKNPAQLAEDEALFDAEARALLPDIDDVMAEEKQIIANIRKNTGIGPEKTEENDTVELEFTDEGGVAIEGVPFEDLTPSGTLTDEKDIEERVDKEKEETHQIATTIRDYCVGHSIALVMKALCERVPEALPNYRTWKCKVDPVDVVRDIIHTKNYVESLIPPLRMMMGANIHNIQWSARVVIAMTVFHAIRTITWQESGAAMTGTFES